MDDAEVRVRGQAVTQDWLITAGQALATGMTRSDVRTQLRAGRWQLLLRGVYLVDPDLYADGLPARTWWRAALLAHGANTCLVAGTGARALGVQGLPLREERIEIGVVGLAPRHQRRPATDRDALAQAGLRVVLRQFEIPRSELVVVDGLPVRAAQQTIVDAALDLQRPRALTALDSALRQQLISPEELAASLAEAKGRPGIEQLRAVAHYADGRAQSPVESGVRLCCIDEHVAPDDLQYPVYDPRGHLVAIGDLAWHKRRKRPLLAEADGAEVHATPQAVYRDRGRGNALVAENCDTVRFTYADTLRPRYIGYVVRQALAA